MRALKAISKRQRGFSLIELLVGVVVGLLAVLVITQVMALAEGKRRTVSMGGDAQVNGALALFTLQRDIQQSGYGAVAMPDAIGCTVKYKNTAGSGTFTLAPVVIASGGAANVSDSVTVLQGNTVNFSAPILLSGVATQADDHFTVKSSFGAAVGDMMILVPQGWTAPPDNSVPCGLLSVTSAASPATATLTNTNLPHASSNSWNQTSVFPSTNVASGSYLMDMGTLVSRTYSVSALGNLQGADLSLTDGSTTTADLYPQIVMMQAMYGKDANGDGTIDAYDKTTPITSADWQKVKAIRIALVARSNQYEKDVVTSTAPLWDVGTAITVSITGYTTAACNNGSNCLTLDVSKTVGTDWQHYRYKVYDTIVPLRNVLWNS
jgi:type IV pilus assembly protein PilW